MARIGIDLGGTKIEGLALGDRGEELARRRISAPRDDYGATLAAVAGLVAWLDGVVNSPVPASVGVGIPGALSALTGLVKNANSTWLNGHPLDRDLTASIGRPVRLQNDANCLALSEAADGAGAGCGTVFAAILGTGCGGGVVVDGRIITGRHAAAGEWGHSPLPWPQPPGAHGREDERPGPACYCGHQGCLETWLSGPGLADDHTRATGRVLPAVEVAALAAAGDGPARAALDRHVDRLARGLAGVVNLLDPDVIVLGGGLSNMAHLYERLPERLAAWCFSPDVTTPIRPARHGDSSGVRGAAWLWPAQG
ncbi:ROK family protein [Nitrospirillum sp. BR 11163]|uniref:ROK family protein n=1 Tax=Nitrospirillum sp. BR 11163 TaxID=3104323 RepID=UPI002AFDE2D6|nr:ROK family protein [Nitrospirillum sp. BR 11163]MEA1676046.1 ROK family protein [Nitrospirillum sp. BR 11163]